MKRLLTIVLLAFLLSASACAASPAEEQLGLYDASALEDAVPDGARELLDPSVTLNPELSGAFSAMLRRAAGRISDYARQSGASALRIAGIAALCGVAQTMLASADSRLPIVTVAGCAASASCLFSDAGSLCALARETIGETGVFSRLLMPVLLSAAAASGAAASAGTQYAAVVFVCDVLIALLDGLVVPSVYCHMALALAQSLSGDEALGKVAGMLKNAVLTRKSPRRTAFFNVSAKKACFTDFCCLYLNIFLV